MNDKKLTIKDCNEYLLSKHRSEKRVADFWQSISQTMKLKSRGPSLSSISRRENISLSFAQERLWFLERFQPGSTPYKTTRVFQIVGSLNVAILKKSLSEIVRRHQVLRTVFTMYNQRPTQSIVSDFLLNIPVIEIQGLSDCKKEMQIHQMITDELERSFDLETAPPLRISLLYLEEKKHILLLTMHHVIYDGWSLGIFWKELTELYKAFLDDKPSPLAEISIQYADYAHWQRQWMKGDILESQLRYWKKKLTGISPFFSLPTDMPRPSVQSFQGKVELFQIDSHTTNALKRLSRKSGVTLFTTLLSVFKILLYRYTNQQDVVVGTPIAGRSHKETMSLIGFFINTLVLRTDLSGNPNFTQLLDRVSSTVLDAYTHQHLPFEKLVEELKPERSLSYSPLFQIMFILQNTPETVLELSNLNVEQYKLERVSAKFDLTMSIKETENTLVGEIEYSTDLFKKQTIEQMSMHYKTLIEAVIAEPNQHICSLPLLTSPERYQLLTKWNNTEVNYVEEKCIHELFESQVEQTPDSTAIVFEDKCLTYQNLNYRANQLANYLKKLGVGLDVLVGICVDRSLEMLVGLLGVLKAGGAYIPLDPAYPKERLAFTLKDSRISFLLTQQQLVQKLPTYKGQIVCLDAHWEAISQENRDNPDCKAKLSNLAYMIYTSGSTGNPKGVLITHHSLSNFMQSMRFMPGLTDKDILLAVTTVSFDIAALELYLPLIVGARIVLASRQDISDGSRILKMIVNNAVTVMQATPTGWQLLLNAGWDSKHRLKILCGGEALSRKLASQLLERSISVWNLYGPTESTIWSAIHRVESQKQETFSKNFTESIGRPIANTQFYILDSHLQPVPVGIPGQLYIGGHGLALGYFNRPELTASKFVSNPFSNNPEARLYKTGDLARYLHGGNIEFLGRLDYQVKIRGFRIELGEIEAILTQHFSIKQAVVIVKDDSENKFLIAYVVFHQPKQPLTTKELRNFLKQKLPEYMIPAVFVFLEALPLTPNGKVDRLSLPTSNFYKRELDDSFVSPSNTIELMLVDIWETVLNTRPISIQENFFEIGGHSLLAISLLSEIRRKFGKSFSPITFFQNPTIEQMADIIRKSTNPFPFLISFRILLLLIKLSNYLPSLKNNHFYHQDDYKKIRFKKLFQKFNKFDFSPLWYWNLKLNYYRGLLRSFNQTTSPLIKIKQSGSKKPIFFVPGVVGTVFYLYHLAHHLDSDRPFYGLQARGLDGESEPYSRVEDMASYYIEAIKEIQPKGPYFLGGHSFGGNIAFEMALQLQRQGLEVALLAIVDKVAPTAENKYADEKWDDTRVLGFLITLIENWSNTKLNISYDYLKTLDPDEQFNHLMNWTKKVNWVFPVFGTDYIRGLFRVLKASLNIDYTPKEAYEKQITLLRSEQFGIDNKDRDEIIHITKAPALGWNQLSEEPVAIHYIPGNHITIMAEPNVQRLAQQLKLCLIHSEKKLGL